MRSRRYRHLGLILALCSGLVASCASSRPQRPSAKPTVRPIARFVTRDAFRNPRVYFPHWESSRIEYDGETWFNPVFPSSAVIEDCDDITGIGVVIGVDPTTAAGSRVLARFRWSHSTIKAEGHKYDDFKLPWRGTYQDWISLDGRGKVNGTWTVSVTYHGTEIFQTSFELRNCNHGRPAWADSGG